MPIDLPDGATCFVDANIVYYHYVETPPVTEPCTRLLQRLAEGRLIGYTSIHLLAEAVHKIMLAEAAARFGLNRTGLAAWLQRRPERISELSEFATAAAELPRLGLRIVSPDAAALLAGAGVSRACQLLTNNALTVAMMRQLSVSSLVTNDDDFDAIEGLTVWKPR